MSRRIAVGLSVLVCLLSTVAAAAAPLPPANLTFSQGVTGVTLRWTLASGGDPATTVVIEAGSAPGSTSIGRFDVGLITTLTASLTGGIYFVRVRAGNADGLSAPSNEIVMNIGGFTCTPLAAPVLAVSVSGLSVTLSWTSVVGAGSYVVSAGRSAGASDLVVVDTGNVATTLTATAAPGIFYVRVAARDKCGPGASSNEVTFTAGGTPPPPTGLIVVDSPNPVPWYGRPMGQQCTGLANTWYWESVFTPGFGSGSIRFTHITSVVNGLTTFEEQLFYTLDTGPDYPGPYPSGRRFCSSSAGPHTLVSTFHGTNEQNGQPVAITMPTVVLLPRP